MTGEYLCVEAGGALAVRSPFQAKAWLTENPGGHVLGPLPPIWLEFLAALATIQGPRNVGG